MRHRSGQLDVAHALPANLGLDHLDSTFFTGDTAVFHPLVLAADTLVVVDWTKDLATEQTITFRLEGPVVDGF